MHSLVLYRGRAPPRCPRGVRPTRPCRATAAREGVEYGCDVDKFHMAGLDVQTHIICVRSSGLGGSVYVDGIRTPRAGVGGGSFANHRNSPNAEAVEADGRVYLLALRRIDDGEEIFLDYGSGRDVAFGLARLHQVTLHGRRTVHTRPLAPRYERTTQT